MIVSLNGTDYHVFADIAFANDWLAGDAARGPTWEVLAEDPDKKRALITATRTLSRLDWRDGVPSVDDPPAAVSQAAAVFAADIIAKPSLGDNPNSGSNVKSVGAGPARVEFFRPVDGTPLPSSVYAILRPLLGSAAVDSDPAFSNAAFGSSGLQDSRFPPEDDCPAMVAPGTEAQRGWW